jgi:inositol oxygenase
MMNSSAHKFRQYTNDEIQEDIKNHYYKMRTKQTVDHVKNMHNLFQIRKQNPISIMNAIEKLENFVDVSDPDICMPNIHHLYQTAEELRKQNYPDWMQLVGLLHDLGKLLYLINNDELGLSVKEQWSIVGDTFLVGCRLPDSCVYPEFNQDNPDMNNQKFNTNIGVYQENIGLDNCLCSWGHDEYFYQILKEIPNTLPEEAYYIIRYHSLYPWHTHNAYSKLESSKDKNMKKIVKEFNKFDLYTKEDVVVNIDELKKYYQLLIDKYFPDNILMF